VGTSYHTAAIVLRAARFSRAISRRSSIISALCPVLLSPCIRHLPFGIAEDRLELPLRGWVAVGQIQCVRWELLRQHMTAAPPAAAAPANSTKVPAAAVPVSTVAHSNNLRMYSLLPKNHTQPH
jgi:hypothetical protein